MEEITAELPLATEILIIGKIIGIEIAIAIVVFAVGGSCIPAVAFHHPT